MCVCVRVFDLQMDANLHTVRVLIHIVSYFMCCSQSVSMWKKIKTGKKINKSEKNETE